MNKFVFIVLREDDTLAYGVVWAWHGDGCREKLEGMFPKRKKLDFFGYTGSQTTHDFRLPETPQEAYERGQDDARDAERWHEERDSIDN